ncbi:MAG TPA: DUF4199 family protein [Luteimonas sp.]|nr:DUF4199 family protein [Luteimonas sp.]
MIPRLSAGTLAGLLIPLFTYGPYFVAAAAIAWAAFAEMVLIAAALLCLAPMWLLMRRQRIREGGLTFGRAFATGLGITCVAAAVTGAATWGVYAFTGGVVPQAVHDAYQLQLRTGGGSGAAVDAGLADLAELRPLLFDPVVQALGTLVTVLAAGTVESLLGAWALRAPARMRRR